MPDIYLKWDQPSSKRAFRTAYLYQLIFPNGMVYIGSTTEHPIVRTYRHRARKTKRENTLVSKALNEYNEVYLQILVIGQYKYIEWLEHIAIKHFGTIDPEVGYNKRVAGGPRIGRPVGTIKNNLKRLNLL